MLSFAAALEMFLWRKAVVKYSIALREIAIHASIDQTKL